MSALTQINYEAGRDDLWRVLPIERYEVGGHTLYRMGGLLPIEGATVKKRHYRGLEANIQPGDYPEPEHTDQVHIVALGMGTDSIGMLCEMKRRGIRPDIVQWADTGTERLHTYRLVRVIQAWLRRNGFPPLLIVRKRCPVAGHRSFFEQLWNTKQLPSPAFHRNHSCSVKWKLEPQRDYHRFLPWMRVATTSIGFSTEETGRRIHESVLSADETSRRSYQVVDQDGYETDYPLQRWGMTRSDCLESVLAEGLPDPGKSACFVCPMSTLCEVKAFEEGQRSAALDLEKRAEEGGKLKSVRGLVKGENKTWAEWLEETAA